MTASRERALAGLDPQQREAATALRGPVCVLAGAGTGKTRVITHRIAYGVDTGAYTPSRVMAVTFTTKAAGELRARLRALGIDGVAARTFHASALSQLNYFWPIVAGDSAPLVVDNKVRLLAHAADEVGVRLDTAALRDVAAEIEWRKTTMRSIDAYADAGRPPVARLPMATLLDLQRAYEKLKDERRSLDFEDVLLACAGMIEAEPRVAAAVHEQYRHFTVDEFQDVSPLQERLLELWLGGRGDLCVVGDASQTIYSFAGADSRYLLDFAATHPNTRLVRLERNYRSTAAVLATANALMRGRAGALELTPAAPETAEAGAGAGAQPETVVMAYPSDAAEAAGVAERIQQQIRAGVRPQDIAVLYRAHAQSLELDAALAALGVPSTVLGGKRFFDIPEVRQAVVALRGAAVAPSQGDLVRDVRDVLRSLGMSDEPPAAGGALRDSWEARAALLRLAQDAPAGTTLRAFTDELQARQRDHHEPTRHTVTLSTLHAAKGLEWAHVHMVGLTEGQLPISYAGAPAQIDEERRLAYVGITRARATLSLSFSRFGGRGPREGSRFLREIGIRTTDAGDGSAIRAERPARGR
ncbi:MAG: ATP-dependent helicase [Microbacteriaceae bacterium]